MRNLKEKPSYCEASLWPPNCNVRFEISHLEYYINRECHRNATAKLPNKPNPSLT